MELPWAQLAQLMRASQPAPSNRPSPAELEPLSASDVPTDRVGERLLRRIIPVESAPGQPPPRPPLDEAPLDDAARLEAFRRYTRSGDYTRAAAVLPPVDGTNSMWERYRAILHLLSGDPAAALEAYPYRPSQTHGTGVARLEFAALACLADRWKTAELVISAAMTESQDGSESSEKSFPPALFHLWAMAAAKRGDLGQAIERLRVGREAVRSAQLDRFLVASLLEQAERHRRRGAVQEAIGHWDEAATIDPNCQVAATNRSLARLELGRSLVQRKERAAAVRTYSEILAVKNHLSGYSWHNLALLAESEGDWETALTHWSALLRAGERPGDLPPSELRLRQMRCLVHLRRWERLAQTSAKLVDHERVGTKVLCVQGAALVAARRPAEAVEVFHRCVLAERDGFALRGLSLALIQRGDFEASADVLSQLMALHPEDAWAADRWRAIIQARALRSACLGDWNEAQMYYASMLLQNDRDVDAWLGSGGVHLLAGHRGNAQDSFAQALQLSEDPPRTHMRIGEHYLAAGDRKEADRHFARALAADAAGTAYAIGLLQLRVGDVARAVRSLQLALKHGPDPVQVVRHALAVAPNHASCLEVVGLIAHLRPARALQPDLALLLACRYVEQSAWTQLEAVLEQAQAHLDGSQRAPLRDAFKRIRRLSVLKRTLGEFDSSELGQLTRELVERSRSERTAADSDDLQTVDTSVLVPDMERTLDTLIPERELASPPASYLPSGAYPPDRTIDILDLKWWAAQLAPSRFSRRHRAAGPKRRRSTRPAAQPRRHSPQGRRLGGLR